jgi:hypothetical protein
MNITQGILENTVKQLERVSITEKAQLVDSTRDKQPHLFDMILMQKDMGATLETMDVLMEILLVSQHAAESNDHTVHCISDEQMITALNRFVKEIGFAAGLTPKLLQESIQQYRSNHSEPVLFRWALQQMTEAGLTDFASEQQSALLAGCTIVNCIGESIAARND